MPCGRPQETHTLTLTWKHVPLLHGQIFELRDGSGRIAPIVLKVLKSGALIGDIEREWEAGQKVSQLADQDGNLPVRRCRLLAARCVFHGLPAQPCVHLRHCREGVSLTTLQGFMKVGPALVRPDGKMVGECLQMNAHHKCLQMNTHDEGLQMHTHHVVRLQHTAA
jgi:hypothetical protein